MKARKAIGAATLIIGVFVAVCTADGSAHELAMRLAGVAMMVIGGIVGGFFDKQAKQAKQ